MSRLRGHRHKKSALGIKPATHVAPRYLSPFAIRTCSWLHQRRANGVVAAPWRRSGGRHFDAVVALGGHERGDGGSGGGRRSSKIGTHFIPRRRLPLTMRRLVMNASAGLSSPPQTSAKSASERCTIASTCSDQFVIGASQA